MNQAQKLILFFLLIFGLNATSTKGEVSQSEELYLVLMIDGSLSMNTTDPFFYREMAAQAVFSLLSPGDNVAIVQFASKGELLLPWTKASDQQALFGGINKIGSVGTTDFLLGFRVVEDLFYGVPTDSRKVILLFSDGEFEPSPYSSEYAPLHMEYRLRISGKPKSEIPQIYSAFKPQLTPIAKAKVDQEILPFFKANNIEIFSVAFSPLADKEYMHYLSNATRLAEQEQRFFYVENATDIIDAFLGILPFWQNKVLLLTKEGNVDRELRDSVFADEFLKNLFGILVTDQKVNFEIKSNGQNPETPIKETHPNIFIVPLKEAAPPNYWNYRISGDSGKYKFLVVGESTLRIEIENLKARYNLNEELSVNVLLQIGNQDARPYLSSQPNVFAELLDYNDRVIHRERLEETNTGFEFNFLFAAPGQYVLRFSLRALDAQGRELLPRPSREFIVQVMPHLFVEPAHISFGTVKKGSRVPFLITVNNGLEQPREINISSQITAHSRKSVSDSIPYVSDKFTVSSGTSAELPLDLVVPKSRDWGKFEGEIILITEAGESFVVTFNVHIPSWKEKIGYFSLFLFLILLVGFIFLLVQWSKKKSPVGVLRPVEFPMGTLVNDIKLSRVKRGFWVKHLHWKKNEIIIGGPKSNVYLPGSDSQLVARFLFFRFGRDYIKNESKADPENIIVVRDPSVGINIDLRPGKSYTLSNGLFIKTGEYSFNYEIF